MRSALGPLGPVVAHAGVSAGEWLGVLGERAPLVLEPSNESGWFSGVQLVAVDPVRSGTFGRGAARLSAVGAVLQQAFDSREPVVAAAMVPYSGEPTFAVFSGGLILAVDGWRTWGTLLPDDLPVPLPLSEILPRPLMVDAHSDVDGAGFEGRVEEVREAIRRGDVYVLNLTRMVSGCAVADHSAIFRSLLAGTPASMAAAWSAGDSWLASASPERFVGVRGHEVYVEPVKGTRPRSGDAETDAALRDELANSLKERAEHVMIVDLERNDLGRACVAGSIEVDPLFRVESTAYCHQAVSHVCGLLRPESTLGDLLAATFPCGSITGAPKIAAMRIIDELEVSARGAYTGSLLVAIPGALDSSVLIRTIEGRGDRVTYGTGCGITIDSDAREEWAESVLKTEPVLGPMPSGALRETCRVVATAVPLWRLHRERLRAGGCGEELLDRVDAVVRDALASAGGRTDAFRLTVIVTPEGAVRAVVSAQRSSLDVAGGPLAARVDVGDDMPSHEGLAKPADRSWWDVAHRQAESMGAHQAILVDAAGLVLDGSTAAVWIVEDGALVTPPTPPAIASVSASLLREQAGHEGVRVVSEPISWQRFEVAEEAFLTNALGGCSAIRGRGGARTELVASWFARVWAADAPGMED